MLTRAATPRCGSRTNPPKPPGRLENLKELVRALADFETLPVPRHVAAGMENDDRSERQGQPDDLHGAKGWSSTPFSCRLGEGVFPNSGRMDESGNKGLEEERRLAMSG